VVTDCGQANYFDAVIFAYRICPPLLGAARADPEAFAVVTYALGLGRDLALARSEGVEIRPDSMDDALSTLTSREHDVLNLLLEAKTNAEIARILFITQSTTKVHVRHILAKLGAKNRLQAVLRAQELLEAD
jgi:DNA-binding CsgD family transcriptional regulator